MLLFPLVLSLVGAVFFFITADTGLIWKLLALGLALGAAYMQFFTAVPVAVPVLMQIALCIWFVLYWQIDQMRT